MLRKIISIFVIVLFSFSFFASRYTVSSQQRRMQRTDFNRLIDQMHKKPVTDEILLKFVRGGIPALNFLLNDFHKSKFAEETPKNIRGGFNLGQAMDRDIYVSNVIKVAEEFGAVGVDRLVKRLPYEVVKKYQLDSPGFTARGLATVKPLLTLGMIVQASDVADRGRLSKWYEEFIDAREIEQIDPTGGLGWVWEEITKAYTGYTAWKSHSTQSFLVDLDIYTIFDIDRQYLDMLSPTVRRQMLLRTLNPQFYTQMEKEEIQLEKELKTKK